MPTLTHAPITTGDLDVIRILHNALRRDSVRLERATEGHDAQDETAHDALLLGWHDFNSSLHHHHMLEDTYIWPLIRTKRADSPDDLAVLDAMEEEHSRIDPAIEAIDRVFDDREAGADGLTERIAEFVELLRAHLAHEERDALPLMRHYITHQEWTALSKASMKGLSLSEISRLGPWVLDSASPEDVRRVLQELPPPVRLVNRLWWNPRYQRSRRWE